MNNSRIWKLILAAVLTLCVSTAAWADILDPANLHVGTGAGTAGAQGLGGDPNTIGSGAVFDIYYNTQGNGNLPIGNPFYLMFAVPVYSGSSLANSVSGTATMYSPYPGGTTSTVTVNGQKDWGKMTSGDIYAFIGLGSSTTNSFNLVNMTACDTGTGGCPNGTLSGSGAPLFGKTITGFEIFTYNINTTNFAPGNLLNFTGSNMPVGTFVAAIGVDPTTGLEAWAVPFTESGLTTTTPHQPSVPEPASLVMLGSGLLVIGSAARRRLQKKS